jgi:hypothetical protein
MQAPIKGMPGHGSDGLREPQVGCQQITFCDCMNTLSAGHLERFPLCVEDALAVSGNSSWTSSCAAAHLRARRARYGAALRPQGCSASRCARQPCGLPLTPETTAAPGTRNSGQAQACPTMRAAPQTLVAAGVDEHPGHDRPGRD